MQTTSGMSTFHADCITNNSFPRYKGRLIYFFPNIVILYINLKRIYQAIFEREKKIEVYNVQFTLKMGLLVSKYASRRNVKISEFD